MKQTLLAAHLSLLVLIFSVINPLWAADASIRIVSRNIVEKRLQSYKGDDSQREATLKELFQSGGCTGDNLTEQPVKHLKEPNLICTLPGTTDLTIVVGAHFDHVAAGQGVADNWSGASLLPSLYEALHSQPQRQYTFIFIGFAGEEKGLVGSHHYVEHLSPHDIQRVQAMVTMDTLGLGPTEVWMHRSDYKLVSILNQVALSRKLPLAEMDVDQVGMSDEESFRSRNLPVVMIHSITQSTLGILHNAKDNYSAIHFDDYYDTYRLMSVYLAVLDRDLGKPPLLDTGHK